MFDRYRQAKLEAEDLNLIPIMNLMMTLIPFLLLGAAFYHIGVIPTSLPTHVPQGSPSHDKTKTVTLNLQLEPDKLVMNATGQNVSDADLADMSLELPMKKVEKTIPGKDGKPGKKEMVDEYDLAALQKKLLEIKSQYPKSDTVIVLPEDGVKYQALVDVLDTTREQIIQQGKGKDPIHKALFPVTVFSRLLKPDDSGSTAGKKK